MFQRLIASIREFIDGVRGELKKVSFPSKAETIGATTVVIVFCILMSLYLSMMDSVLGWLMRLAILIMTVTWTLLLLTPWITL